MFCSKCGAQLPDDAVFCSSCGTATANNNPSAQQPNQNTQANTTWNTAPQDSNQNAQANWNTPPQQPQGAPSQNSNTIAALAYIPILFWLPLAFNKNDEFGRKTANQGLLLLIFNAGISIILTILGAIIRGILNSAWMWGASYIVSLILGFLSFAVSGLVLAAWIVGLVKALKGEFFEIPLIGKIKIIK